MKPKSAAEKPPVRKKINTLFFFVGAISLARQVLLYQGAQQPTNERVD